MIRFYSPLTPRDSSRAVHVSATLPTLLKNRARKFVLLETLVACRVGRTIRPIIHSAPLAKGQLFKKKFEQQQPRVAGSFILGEREKRWNKEPAGCYSLQCVPAAGLTIGHLPVYACVRASWIFRRSRWFNSTMGSEGQWSATIWGEDEPPRRLLSLGASLPACVGGVKTLYFCTTTRRGHPEIRTMGHFTREFFIPIPFENFLRASADGKISSSDDLNVFHEFVVNHGGR